MKLNTRLLKQELNKTRKLMEDIAYVNKSDLDGTWSAEYLTRRQQGLFPYDKHGYTLTALGLPKGDKMGTVSGPGDIRKSSSSRLKTAVYLKQEEADELNQLGIQIQDLINQYNEKFQQYSK